MASFYNLLSRAKQSDPEALLILLEHYSWLFQKRVYWNGSFDEDMLQELYLEFLYGIKMFVL